MRANYVESTETYTKLFEDEAFDANAENLEPIENVQRITGGM